MSVFFCLNKEGAEAVMLMFDVVGTEVLVETKRVIIMLRVIVIVIWDRDRDRGGVGLDVLSAAQSKWKDVWKVSHRESWS